MKALFIPAILFFLSHSLAVYAEPVILSDNADLFTLDVSTQDKDSRLTKEQFDYAASVISRVKHRCDKIAERFNADAETLIDYRKRGLGYEELIRILIIAEESGGKLRDIARMRFGKASFERICSKYGVNLKSVRKKTAETMKSLEID